MPITYQGVSLFTEDEMVHVLGKLRKKNPGQVPTALNKFPSVKVNGKNYYSSSMMNRISELYLDYEEGFNLKNKPNRTTAENLRILDLNQKTITQHTDLNNYLKTDFVNDPIYNQLSDPVNKPTFAQNFLSMSYGKEKFTFSDLISGLITGTSDFKEKSMRLDKSYYDPRPSHSKSVEHLKQLIPDDPVRHTSSKDKPWWLYMNTGGFIPNKENSDFNKVFSGFSDLFSQSQKNQTKTNSLLENFGNSSKSSQYMASGGQLGNHPGDSKGSDTIPAWLSPNEYVINSASATANKSLLDKINQSKGPIYLAGGGAAASTMGQKTTGFVSDTFDTAQLAFRAAAGDPTAVLGLVTKQIGKMTENIQKQINAPFDLISGKSEKAGDALISVGNALGGPAGFFANVIGQSVESLRSWNAQLLQSNLQFAEFSGSMAQVAANQQIRDMEMSMARGERRAGIAEKQAKSSYELEKRLAVFEDALANVRGEVLTNLNKIATNAIDDLLEKLITDYHYFFLPILAWFSDKAGKDPGDMGLKGPYDDMSDTELIQRGWIRGNASGVEDASNVDIPERWRR